jgi:hypothetical protein
MTTAMDVKNARVIIELDGEEVTLIPSPDAIISLSAKYDGFAPLVGALQRLNVQAAIDVVTVGAGVKDKAAKAMQAQVVTEGVVTLMPKLIEFVMVLSNGGKPLTEPTEGEGTEDPSR